MKKCDGYPLIKCGNLLTSLKTGPFGSALNTEHWTTNGTAVLTIGSLGEQSIIEDELLYISDSYAEKLNPYKVNEGDIVFSRVADIGRAQLIDKKQDGWVISSNLMKMTVNKELIRPAFLYIAIKDSPVVTGQFKSHSNGNGRLLVNSSIVKSIKIPTPELAVQDKLINIISSWDNAIKKTESLIAAKEKQFEWLKSQLLLNNPKSAQWNTSTLGEFIVEKKEKSSTPDLYPCLTSSRRGIFLQEDYFSKQVASKDNSGYKIISRGDFTFRSMSDDGIFVFNKQTIIDNGLISPAYGVFSPKENMDSDFLYYFLNSPAFRRALSGEVQGGTRTALKLNALKSLDVEIPDLSEQKDISSKLNNAKQEIDLLKGILDKYRSQKRGLMQKLLTGKWRVSSTLTATEDMQREHTKEEVA